MNKEIVQSEQPITFRDQRISYLTKIKNFYLGEWAREGYSEDSQRAMRASLDIIKTLEDKDPNLDRISNSPSNNRFSFAIAEKSVAGRTLILQL